MIEERHITALSEAKKCLENAFEKLVVAADETGSLLHIWNRLKPKEEGTILLPGFHLILTAKYDDQDECDKFQSCMYSFNGKMLMEVTTNMTLECLLKIPLLKEMEEEKLCICSGIQNLNLAKWKNYTRLCKLPDLERVRSIFTFENFYEQSILRSRFCRYLVPRTSSGSSISCVECSRLSSDGEKLNQLRINEEMNGDSRLRMTSNEDRNGFNCYLEGSEKVWVTTVENVPEDFVKSEADETCVENDQDFKEEEEFEEQEPPRSVAGTVEVVLGKGLFDIRELKKLNRQLIMKKEKEKVVLKKKRELENLQILKNHHRMLAPKRRKRTSLLSLQEYHKAPKIQCKICLVFYRAKEMLDQCMDKHIDKMSLSVPAACPICEENLPLKMEIPDHFAAEHKPKTCCCECLKVFDNNVLAHEQHVLEVHHREFKKKFNNPPPTLLQCKICMLTFKQPSMLLKCMGRHEEEMDLKKPFSCPLCEEEIESKLKVTDHFETVHNQEMKTCCCECGLVMDNKYGNLRKHILEQHHKANKAHLCSECGKAYHSKVGLESHIGTAHTTDTNFVCQHCGAMFGSEISYKRHVKRHDPKDIPCNLCGKLFGIRGKLLKHLRYHSGIKAFQCKSCNYKCYNSDNVCIHAKKVHGKSGTVKDLYVLKEEKKMMDAFVEENSK